MSCIDSTAADICIDVLLPQSAAALRSYSCGSWRAGTPRCWTTEKGYLRRQSEQQSSCNCSKECTAALCSLFTTHDSICVCPAQLKPWKLESRDTALLDLNRYLYRQPEHHKSCYLTTNRPLRRAAQAAEAGGAGRRHCWYLLARSQGHSSARMCNF